MIMCTWRPPLPSGPSILNSTLLICVIAQHSHHAVCGCSKKLSGRQGLNEVTTSISILNGLGSSYSGTNEEVYYKIF